MDIRGRRPSSNVEDRRGMSPVRKGVGVSVGGVLFLIVLSLFGINPLPFLGVATKEPQVEMEQSPQPYQESAAEAEVSLRAKVVMGETEETWGRLTDGKYTPPTLVIFNEATQSECGVGQAAMGPFYCPLDQKVFIDLSFFQDLESKFGAPGDFAQAYVIAHEVGHHVQNLTGAAQRVQQAQQRAGRNTAEANQQSVMLELQADCYAGVWARDAAPRLKITQQDIEEGMRAASAIGDDRLQKASQGRVVPDAFTHGSSEQRMRWLMAGMNSGDPSACDTFSARTL